MLIRNVMFVFALTFSATALAADPRELPAYQRGKEVAGTLSSVGSDTMAPLLNRWSQTFRRFHPRIEFSIETKGSGTAAAALVEGRSQLAPMSRPMNAGEVASFGARYGYAPIGIRVAFDAVGVYVHRDNPITGLTLEQLDGIFSANQRCGGKRIERWGELVKNWRNEAIATVGRNKLSGTHDFFRSHAMCDGDFAPDYDDEPDSSNVVYKVATNPNAIGYAGVGYITSNVKPVPLAKRQGDPYESFLVEDKQHDRKDARQTYSNVTAGRYPLSRFLFIYINKEPKRRLSPLVEEFLSLVLSKDGQEAVKESGFIPIEEDIAAQQRTKLQPSYTKPWWEQD